MKKRMVLVGLLSVAVWWCRPLSAGATVLINELLADPPASIGDANHDGVVSTTQDEFVELINTSAVVVSLANWKLSDAVQVRHTFSPIAAIPAYGFYLVFGGGSPVGFSNAAVASSGGLSLNNTAETVILKDATSLVIDTLTYGAEGGADVSLTRSPDGVGSFVKHTSINANRFSPGSTVDGLTELPHEDNPDDGGEDKRSRHPGAFFVDALRIGRPRSTGTSLATSIAWHVSSCRAYLARLPPRMYNDLRGGHETSASSPGSSCTSDRDRRRHFYRDVQR